MPSESEFIQILDAAMSEAVRRGGSWIACKPGCCHCCRGPFPISPRDAARLRQGLADLAVSDPARAGRVRARSQEAAGRLPELPLSLDVEEFEARIDLLPEEEPCPVLDPESGTCDLYSSRPITCRTFGPAVRLGSDAIGACELCYEGATAEEIAACAVDVELDAGEEEGAPTLVALALTV